MESRLRWLLASVLLAAYLLVYTNQPATIDGEATLAVADSLSKHTTPDIMILGSAEGLLPPISRMGTFGQDGLLYAKKGIVPSLLLLPLVALASFGFPLRASAMLFNPIVTILTALTLYSFARRLDYRPRSALLAALLYGLATLAIVYTRTLFGEPLAGLLLLLAVISAHRYRQQPELRIIVWVGLLLGMVCGVNFTYVFAAPIVGLYALGMNPQQWRVRPSIALMLPCLLIIALLLAFNALRFGSPFNSGYNFDAGEGFTSPFGLGVFGLLLSPYRGLFWYNPILLLIMPGIFFLRRQALTYIVLLLLGIQVITYAAWWSWHGGIVWGPRFLLPIIPLLMLLILPILEQIKQQRLVAISVGLLCIISVIVQIPALLYDFVPYTMSLYDDYAAGVTEGFFTGLSDEVVYRLDLSPILGQFRMLQAGTQPLQLPHDIVQIILVITLLILGIVVWRWQNRHARWIVMPLLILAPLGIVSRQTLDPTAIVVEQQLLPADQIVIASTDYAANLLDVSSRTRIITTNAPTLPDDPLVAGLWDHVLGRGGLTWFVTWFPPGSAENWQERDLWEQAAFVREMPFNGNRALLFNIEPPIAADQTGGWQFGPVQLTAYSLAKQETGLHLTLDWIAMSTIEQNYSWFVHLLDSRGQIIQQQDRQPQGGYAPTSTWQPGEHTLDYLYFPLPTETDATDWQIRIGFVDPDSGERLPVTDPDGATLSDGFILIAL